MGRVYMVSSVGNTSNQQSVPELLKKQNQRNEDLREKEADRLARQAKLVEEEQTKAQEARKVNDDRRGLSIDVTV
jgi:predicted proteasome-type protease